MGVTRFTDGIEVRNRIETITAARTLTAEDSGKLIVVGAADLTATLPRPQDGLRYDFVVKTLSASTGFAITATGAIIVGNGSAGATTLTNSAATDVVGDAISLESDGTNWFVTNEEGTWANT